MSWCCGMARVEGSGGHERRGSRERQGKSTLQPLGTSRRRRLPVQSDSDNRRHAARPPSLPVLDCADDLPGSLPDARSLSSLTGRTQSPRSDRSVLCRTG